MVGLSVDQMEAGSRCASRARPRCARTLRYEPRLVGPSSAGSGTLQCTSSGRDRNSGQTSRTRSHSVITVSNRWRDELVDVLGAVRADVDSTLVKDADRVGMQWLGWLPALAASIAPDDMRSSSASAIWDRALFPVQRNNTRGRRREPRGSWTARCRRCEGERGMQRSACALEGRPAGGEVDRVIAVAADPPSCGAPSRDLRRGAGAGGTTPGSAARRPAPSAP